MSNPLKNIFSKQLILLVALMLAGIVFVVWWQTKPNKRVNQSAEQVVTIADLIRKSYINKLDYWGLNTENVISNNILTNNFYKDNKIVNAMGKPVLIGQGAEGNTILPSIRSFDIVYMDLSQSECIALASYNYEQQENLGLLKITIVNKEGSREFTWGEEDYSLPVLRPEARKFCQNNAKVIWTME